MSQTTTALGTVPQTIVNLDGTDLVASATFTTAVEFDTHGAERIALHVDANDGGYGTVTVRFLVQDAEESEWYVAVSELSSCDLVVNGTVVDQAFQFMLGRNIDKFRVQYKTDGGAVNASSQLIVKGQLTAPTFPIIGGTL